MILKSASSDKGFQEVIAHLNEQIILKEEALEDLRHQVIAIGTSITSNQDT